MKSTLFGIVAAVSLVSAGSAQAEDAYVRLESGASVLKLPSNLFFALREESAPFSRLGDLDADSGVLAGIAVNLVFGADLPTPVLGADSSTIEFAGAFQNIWGSTSASFFDAGPGARFGWVEMPYTVGRGTNTGQTLLTTTNRSAQYTDVQALLKNKYGQFEVFAGPDVRLLNQQLTILGQVVAGPVTGSLVEVLSTVYGGVTVGASFDVVNADDWLVNILGAVSILGAHTQYDATYDDHAGLHQTARLTDQQFAVGAKAKITVEKQIAPNTTLGGYASVDFLSYSPQVKYGSSPLDPAQPVLHIAGAPMFGGSVGLTLKHKFD